MPAIDSFDLLKTAEKIAAPDGPGRPLTTHIRRAVSTIYYALFDCISASNADMLVGRRRSKRYSKEAWNAVYRALSHRQTARRCERLDEIRFPMEIQCRHRAVVSQRGSENIPRLFSRSLISSSSADST